MFQTILRARLGLWLSLLLLGLTLKIGLAQELSPNPQPDPLDTELSAAWTQQVLPVIKQHCGECHMDGANEAGVNLGDYSTLEKIRSHESTWEQIRGVIRADAMPPPESSKMTPQERAIVTRWIERTLHEVDCNHRPPTPHVTVRRLNQFEYDNTIQHVTF